MTRRMLGFVDLHGRAIIELQVRASDIAARHDVQAWIDTGFTGDLILPQQMIDDLELTAGLQPLVFCIHPSFARENGCCWQLHKPSQEASFTPICNEQYSSADSESASSYE